MEEKENKEFESDREMTATEKLASLKIKEKTLLKEVAKEKAEEKSRLAEANTKNRVKLNDIAVKLKNVQKAIYAYNKLNRVQKLESNITHEVHKLIVYELK